MCLATHDPRADSGRTRRVSSTVQPFSGRQWQSWQHTWRYLCSVSCWVGTYSLLTPISLCVDIDIVVVTQHSDNHLTQGVKVKVVPWRCICAPNVFFGRLQTAPVVDQPGTL